MAPNSHSNAWEGQYVLKDLSQDLLWTHSRSSENLSFFGKVTFFVILIAGFYYFSIIKNSGHLILGLSILGVMSILMLFASLYWAFDDFVYRRPKIEYLTNQLYRFNQERGLPAVSCAKAYHLETVVHLIWYALMATTQLAAALVVVGLAIFLPWQVWLASFTALLLVVGCVTVWAHHKLRCRLAALEGSQCT